MTNEQAIKVLLDEWKCIDRNDGINCDRQCEKCDLVMDSAILKDAYNMAIQALELEYKTAFQIACALLNGDILYGTDAESIFSEIMKKDGCVCSFDYENYILTHLNELRGGKA